MAFEDNANVVFIEGNYSDYETDKKRRLGNDDTKRKKYRRINDH